MAERVHHNPNLIYSVGMQVVVLRNIMVEGGRIPHPRGSTVNSCCALSYSARSPRSTRACVGNSLRGVPRGGYQRLTAELERAYGESRLPETASAAAALDDLLVRVRLRK